MRADRTTTRHFKSLDDMLREIADRETKSRQRVRQIIEANGPGHWHSYIVVFEWEL